MIIFKFIEDKDVFQKFYSRALAKRIIVDCSASDEAENTMLCRIKDIYGFDYIEKLQKMYTDYGLSKEISAKFKDVCFIIKFKFYFKH